MSTPTRSRPPIDDAEGPTGRPNLYRRFVGNELHFTPGDPGRRMRVLAIAFVVILALYGGRLLMLQGVDSAAMAERAESGRLATTTLVAPRGTIYDARGIALAQTVEARNVIVDQTLIEDPAAEAAKLAPLLGLPVDDVQKSLTGSKRFSYVARAVNRDTWDKLDALRVPGLASEKTGRRDYPASALGANVLGFVGVDGKGLAGLELALDERLAGVDGHRSIEVADGRRIPTGTDREESPVPGTSVRLTIDRDLQWVAQSAIARQVKEAQAQSGSVVLMEAKTGRVLAMASVPTIDPNDPGNTKAADQQNRSVVEAFEPGSTSKVMTMAAVINEGKANAGTTFNVPDTITRSGRSFSDHDQHPTWELTLAGVLAKSSNTGTIQAAELIGKDKLYEYLKRFGVGERSGLGFPGEGTGYVPPVKDWSDSSFPTIAFGQGLSMSALQAASVYQTLGNGGVRITPQLIDSYIDAEGHATPAKKPTTAQVVEPGTAAEVMKMMEEVVSKNGTAPMAAIPGYRIAGKTGTANRIDDSCGCYKRYTASFIGVAPADDPQLVAVVVLQDPQNGHYGGALGAPVFKEVMTTALQTLRIPPSGTPPPDLPIYAGGASQ
ncbi:MAG TPA: penicillin-binding protein 2 [Actinomycetota bacterium]|nr:penicillin-binding protein 2 [Actinomycetota bacterium]